MAALLGLLIIADIVALVIGLINPSAVTRWGITSVKAPCGPVR